MAQEQILTFKQIIFIIIFVLFFLFSRTLFFCLFRFTCAKNVIGHRSCSLVMRFGKMVERHTNTHGCCSGQCNKNLLSQAYFVTWWNMMNKTDKTSQWKMNDCSWYVENSERIYANGRVQKSAMVMLRRFFSVSFCTCIAFDSQSVLLDHRRHKCVVKRIEQVRIVVILKWRFSVYISSGWKTLKIRRRKKRTEERERKNAILFVLNRTHMYRSKSSASKVLRIKVEKGSVLWSIWCNRM